MTLKLFFSVYCNGKGLCLLVGSAKMVAGILSAPLLTGSFLLPHLQDKLTWDHETNSSHSVSQHSLHL